MQTASANPATTTTEAKELRLLFACARTDANIAAGSELLVGIDWNAFLKLLTAHHVVPLTYKSLAKLGDRINPDLHAALRQAFQQNTCRCLFLMGQLVQLIALLEENKIPVVPFKGPALALQAYRDVAARQCGDLDVLIHPRQVVEARKILLSRGFTMMFPTSSEREAKYLVSMSDAEEANYIHHHSEYHFFREKDGLNIDLHWRLNPPEMVVAFDEEALWGRLQTFQFACRPVSQLGPADQLLLLCFNGAKDCWKRLDRICDIAELLRSHPNADWNEAFDRARDIGVERMVLLGLALAGDILEAPLYGEMESAIRRDSTVRALVSPIRRDLATPMELLDLQGTLAPTLLQLKLRERWSDRFKICFAQLNPTVGDWVAFPLPPSLSFLHYVLRPFRLAVRSIR